jgi:ABC-type nitrate/sulfonate/bicarbonate transport system ATPase subunit
MSAYIQVAGIARSFATPRGPRHVLRDVTLEVAHGEFVSILGAMGSGKSTLLAMLAGLDRPDAGTVTVGGEVVRGVRADAAYVFQNYSLLPWLTAIENVRLAIGATFPQMTRREQREHAAQALERVGLGNALQKRPGQLSGGMRQRVAIARAFATRPKVLFMDEPFGALDALTRETLQQDLAKLCADRDEPVTTVMITNSVEEAILLSDRIVPILSGPPLDVARDSGRVVGPSPATLGTPIPDELSRPRSVAQLAHEEQATQVRATVVSTLTASMGRRKSAMPSAPMAQALEAAEETR